MSKPFNGGPVCYSTAPNLDIPTWLTRWQRLMGKVLRQETQEFQLSQEFCTWVEEWPSKEMNFLIGCLQRCGDVMNSGKGQLEKDKPPPKRYKCPGNINLGGYAIQWKSSQKEETRMLELFDQNRTSRCSTREGCTFVTKIKLSPETHQYINVVEWLKRWKLLMAAVEKELFHENYMKYRLLDTDFWTWVNEWQKEPMEFLRVCMIRFDSVLQILKKGNISSDTRPGQVNLNQYAKEWNEDLESNLRLLQQFECSSGPVLEAAGQSQLEKYSSPGKPEKVRYHTTPSESDQWELTENKDNTMEDQKQTISDQRYEVDRHSRSVNQDQARKHYDKVGTVPVRQKEKRERLQRTKSSFEKEDTPSKLLDAIESKDKEIGRLNEIINRITADNDRLSDSVSKLMHMEISRDESSLESISIKNRPMKIAEEYQLICSNQWLEAKQAVDSYTSDTWDEELKNHFMMSIILRSYLEVQVMYKRQRQQLAYVLENPLQSGSQSGGEKAQLPKFTTDLDQALSRYLKIQSQAVDVKAFAQNLFGIITAEFSRVLRYLMEG